MFTPPGQDPVAVRTILFVFVLAMLASICSRQMAHGAERFLADEKTTAQLCLRTDASITGDEIRLRQIARWSDADKPTLEPIGDLIVSHFGEGQGFKNLELRELKSLLTDAGVNLATVNFVGPMVCRIERADASFAPGQALEQAAATTQKTPTAAVATTADSSAHSLRRRLIENLAEKLNLNPDDLQVTFRPVDEAVLRRCEPQDTFDIRPQRAGNLGDVSWGVTISGNTRAFITAHARAWQQQVVVNGPLAARATITEADVTDRRQLIDNIGPNPVLAHDKVVGQAASRDLKAGTIVTSAMVDPVKLVHVNQDVTVDTVNGGINLRTAAKALSDGTMGQTVQCRNEQTRQIFMAVVTGPKQVSLNLGGMAGSIR